jgi:phage-related protein
MLGNKNARKGTLMPDFPLLKTGATAQYPLDRGLLYSTEVLRFVDGSEQRYSNLAAPIRRWVITLEQLDDAELHALDRFFVEQQGSYNSFRFVDPADNTEYPDCSLEDPELYLEWSALHQGRAKIVIRQNP